MCVDEVRTTIVSNDSNPEGPTNNDDGTSNKQLKNSVHLEPRFARIPAVSRHQSSQREENQEPKHTKEAVSDNHSVGLG